MKIFVASSYHSKYVDKVIEELRESAHDVYDFKHPRGEQTGFEWSKIDGNWQTWPVAKFVWALKNHIAAIKGFEQGRDAIDWADALVLVTPCGRSAHTEFGYAAGKGKLTAILMMEHQEPDLMYGFADYITGDLRALQMWLGSRSFDLAGRRVPESKL